MALYLIRHGQTDYNAQQRFQGRVDVPLNNTGRKQAAALRRLLEHERVELELVFSSPLVRATETARIIMSDLSAVVVDKNLIEIHLGDYDGRLETEIAQQIGERDFNDWRSRNFIVSAPGGESMEQAMERVRKSVEEFSAAASACDVGIVAHQGILMAIKCVVSGRLDPDTLQRYKQANDKVEVWDAATGRHIHSMEC